MKYSRFILLIIFIGILAITGWFLTQQPQVKNNSTTTITVLMKKDQFEPETLTIKKGTTVIFKNEDDVARWPASNLHPSHNIYPEFDPREPIDPGESWTFTFDQVGSWKHHDHLIPSIRGVITVN